MTMKNAAPKAQDAEAKPYWSCAETDPDRADRMAIAAAPYMHVKKKGTTVSDGLVVQITPFDASVA
jgi:hypothetical protein